MSKLIDEFIIRNVNNSVEIRGRWYMAKPIPNITFKNKIKDCIKILKNKAIAVHFKEDEED